MFECKNVTMSTEGDVMWALAGEQPGYYDSSLGRVRVSYVEPGHGLHRPDLEVYDVSFTIFPRSDGHCGVVENVFVELLDYEYIASLVNHDWLSDRRCKKLLYIDDELMFSSLRNDITSFAYTRACFRDCVCYEEFVASLVNANMLTEELSVMSGEAV